MVWNWKSSQTQGYIISPYLFYLYGEYIMRKSNLDDIDDGVGIGGRCINNLRYADDTTLLAESKEDLMKLLQKVKEECEKAGLYLNLKQIKILSTEKIDVLRLGDDCEESFIFLRSKIEATGARGVEIN